MRGSGGFFSKIGYGFVVVCCFVANLLLALACNSPESEGGLGMPGLVAFLLWAGMLCLLVRFPAGLSTLAGSVVFLVLYGLKYGAGEDLVMLCLLLGILSGVLVFFSRSRFGSMGRRSRRGVGRAPAKRSFGGGIAPRKKAKGFSSFLDDRADEEDEDYYGIQSRREAPRPDSTCCEYLREFESGCYSYGMSQMCSILGSQMTVDDARRQCYYRSDFEKCPVRIKEQGGTWKGRGAGMGKTPNSDCCKFLKEYPSGYYDYYSHRCEATEEEIPDGEARQRCYWSEGYKNCPVWKRCG